MASRSNVLQVQDLKFGWAGRPLFQGLSLAVPPGVSLVTGDDGCGKSTLLRLIAGDLATQGGSLALPGTDAGATTAAWRQRVFWIDPHTDAHDAVRAGDYLTSLPAQYPDFSAEAVAELVEGFALEAHLAKPLYMLSAGSRRKVWLTAAFAAGTPLTLIDQPFAALDGPAMRFLRELLQDVAGHPRRAWLIADHEAPAGVPLASTIQL